MTIERIKFTLLSGPLENRYVSVCPLTGGRVFPGEYVRLVEFLTGPLAGQKCAMAERVCDDLAFTGDDPAVSPWVFADSATMADEIERAGSACWTIGSTGKVKYHRTSAEAAKYCRRYGVRGVCIDRR